MSISIIIDEPDGGHVFSGQHVKGTLQVTSSSVLAFTSASILLRGTSKTKFTRTKVELGVHHGKIGVKPKVETFEQRVLLLNTIFHMVRPVEGQILQLDPGTHEFAFRFTLPPCLPPSADPVHGCRIRYRLKAVVQRPELLKKNLKATRELNIGGYESGATSVHALLYPTPSSRSIAVHQSGARKYIGNTGSLIAKLTVANPCMRMDQALQIKVHIWNQTSGQTVSAVRLHLIERSQVFAEGESDSSNRQNSWSKTPVDITPGGNCSLNLNPRLGDKWKVCPSVSSTLISITHVLELQVCVASKFSIDLRVRLPIRLFHNDHWTPVAAPAALPAPNSAARLPLTSKSAMSPAVQPSPASSISSQISAQSASTVAAASGVSAVTDLALPNGSSYTGEVLRGKPHGQGTLTSSTYQFAGLFQNGDAVDGVQLDNNLEAAVDEPEHTAAATDATAKFDGSSLVHHLCQICPACNVPPPSALQPVLSVAWNGVCDTSSWVHTAQLAYFCQDVSLRPLLDFLCEHCPVFDADIFHSASDHFSLVAWQDILGRFLASGVVSSIGTPSTPFYCTNVTMDAAKSANTSSRLETSADQHYDIDPGSCDASESDAAGCAAPDADCGNSELVPIPDAVISIADAALVCLHKLSNLAVRPLPATIAASASPWRSVAHQASENTGDSLLFAKFLCTFARLSPLLSSSSHHLEKIANFLDTSFETCLAFLFCGLPSIAMNVLSPLASAVMIDSCGICNSARICLLSLGAHALILNGNLVDALTMLSAARSLSETLADDPNTQSRWLLACASHQERKAFQDYAGCEEITSRCLKESLHPHARVFVSLMQLSVKPVMLKLSGSSDVSRAFSWPVHLQLVDKFSLPVPLLLMFETCASQLFNHTSSSAADILSYQEQCALIVAASISMCFPKVAVAALVNLKTAWPQDHVVCGRILASTVDVCRVFEFQLPLLQASDAFIFYARRSEVRLPAIAHARFLY